RSRAAPARSSATSSPSGCWVCRDDRGRLSARRDGRASASEPDVDGVRGRSPREDRRAAAGFAALTTMRIAILVKQVPKFEAMELGPGGRLVREGLELELNPYCRRAVSKGVELAAATGGTCTVITLGPPAAEDVLREAIAWGADRGVLVTDEAFAGSDTLATARALAAVLEREG